MQRYTQEMDYASFSANDLVIDAVVRNLSIIGESVSHLPEDFRAKHDEIPWRDIKNFRNVVIHKYHQIDVETVWSIVDDELVVLKTQVQAIVDAKS